MPTVKLRLARLSIWVVVRAALRPAFSKVNSGGVQLVPSSFQFECLISHTWCSEKEVPQCLSRTDPSFLLLDSNQITRWKGLIQIVYTGCRYWEQAVYFELSCTG